MLNYFKILLFVLVLLPIVGMSSSYDIQVVENTAQSIRIIIDFDEPSLVSVGDKFYAHYKGTQLLVSDNYAIVPHLVKFFNLAVDQKINPKIVSVIKKTQRVDNYYFAKSERLQPFQTSEIVTTQYLGKYGNLPVHALHIFPVRYDISNKSLEWIKTIEIEVSVSTRPSIL